MKTDRAERAEAALRAVALGYPEAYEDHPWGDTVFKVRGKVFVFMGAMESGEFGISTKLPLSNAVALMLPFASPTRYGLGKSGWVSARFGPKEEFPLDMLSAWIDESYRAVAPKKLAATLPKLGAAPPAREPPAGKARPAAAKKAPPKAAVKKAPAKPAAPKAAAKRIAKKAPANPAASKAAAKRIAKKAPARPAAPKAAVKKAPPKKAPANPAAKRAAAKPPR